MTERTTQQNKALHLWFKQCAETLNEAGMSVTATIHDDFELDWTAYNFKEIVWRSYQQALFGSRSTAELSTKELMDVYENINRQLGEKFGVYIPFPSWENQQWSKK